MRRPATSRAPLGFSLVELVIVVVIIGIIGAIAIPRLSRGAGGATASKLKQDLAVMNRALDLYAAEHLGQFPNAANVEAQLTQYTSEAGKASPKPDAEYRFGPYLRRVPPAPAGANPGATGIADKPGLGVGWLYDPVNGRIYLNRGQAVDIRVEDEALGRARDLLDNL